VKATSRQLWRLQKEGLLRIALERSGGDYVEKDVAHELIAAWYQARQKALTEEVARLLREAADADGEKHVF
jgi:hypothetical protein